jgi:hypothetical protein
MKDLKIVSIHFVQISTYNYTLNGFIYRCLSQTRRAPRNLALIFSRSQPRKMYSRASHASCDFFIPKIYQNLNGANLHTFKSMQPATTKIAKMQYQNANHFSFSRL